MEDTGKISQKINISRITADILEEWETYFPYEPDPTSAVIEYWAEQMSTEAPNFLSGEYIQVEDDPWGLLGYSQG